MDLATSTWALVVGIDQYQGKKIRPLKGAARDAVAAARWLRSLGVPDEQILFHAHPNPAAKQDVKDLDLTVRGCTNDELVESILFLERSKGTRLFIFLSGHGLFEPTTGPLFLTQDAREGCMRNLGLNEYIKFFMSFKFPKQFLFLDGCLNHPYRKTVRQRLSAEGPPARIGTYTERQATTLWACLAAENGETALEDEKARRGLFLRYLLEAVDPARPHPEVVRKDPKNQAVVVNLFYAVYKVAQQRVVEESIRKGRAHHPGLGTYGRRGQRPDSVILYTLTPDAASSLTSQPAPARTVTSRPYDDTHDADAHRPPPLPPEVVGREREVHWLVTRLQAGSGGPILVRGPRGIGKSTVCLVALRDPDVEHRFGPRRYHVGCDGVESRDGVVTELARALGASWAGEDASAYVRTRLTKPSLVVLDGLDLACTSDAAATEALLADIADAPEVTLVATLRGDRSPSGLRWEELSVGRLDADAARRLFLGVSGDRYSDDPQLDELVETQDGVPLALERLAYLAEAEADLERLLPTTRAALKGSQAQADAAVHAALELSLKDPRLEPAGLRLLRVLALLPDGLPRDRVTELLPDIGEDAMALVQRVGLADDDGRRMHARQDVREHLLGRADSNPPDVDVLVESVLAQVAAYAPLVGGVGGAGAAASLAEEIRNVTTVLQKGLRTGRALECVVAAIELGGFLRFSGLGSVAVLKAARATAIEAGAMRLHAQCERALADISLYRSSYKEARARYTSGEQLLADPGKPDPAEAEAVARMGAVVPLDPAVGRAVCIKGIGHVALARHEYDVAARRYVESLELCRGIGEHLGEADNLAALADVAMALGEYDRARRLYAQAEELYKSISHARGIANCIAAEADVHLVRRRLQRARRGYEEAHPLFAEIGHVHGEGKCFKGRGDVALRQRRTEEAIDAYQSALGCYEQVGDVLPQVQCLDGLVEAYQRKGEVDRRREALERKWELERELVRSPPAAEQARELLTAVSDGPGPRTPPPTPAAGSSTPRRRAP
jgi:tetratricopeptide (TPR) repeat protein